MDPQASLRDRPGSVFLGFWIFALSGKGLADAQAHHGRRRKSAADLHGQRGLECPQKSSDTFAVPGYEPSGRERAGRSSDSETRVVAHFYRSLQESSGGKV